MKIAIGERIRNLRISKGMTQKQLAMKLHVSNCAVSRYEKGKADPELSTLDDLASLFQVDYNYLFDYRENLQGSER